MRMKADGTNLEIFARGIRNSVGFTWHPVTKELWFTDNGRDFLGDDLPPDELNRANKPGLHFGYPYCHGGDLLDPEFGKGKKCSDYVPPLQKLGPHVAALVIESRSSNWGAMVFLRSTKLSPKVGYKKRGPGVARRI